jgi:hypothetical protein
MKKYKVQGSSGTPPVLQFKCLLCFYFYFIPARKTVHSVKSAEQEILPTNDKNYRGGAPVLS